MIVAQRIPVWDIPCCSGVIVEDVLSPRGALLVPKGKNLSKMGDSRFSFAATLEYQGISYVTVKESVDFALGEVLEVLESLRIPSSLECNNSPTGSMALSLPLDFISGFLAMLSTGDTMLS
jgi:hypothetical protein